MGLELLERQLFTMKRKGLEKRFLDYYKETKNAPHIIEAALAVQVRNALTTDDFSYVAKDLVRELFFTADDLQSVRRLCFFFRSYFTDEEWGIVIERLFENPVDYLNLTQQFVPGIEKLSYLLYSGSREEEEDVSLHAVFRDEAENKHKWRLNNAERNHSPQEGYELMCILGFLTILKKDGIRRFAKPVSSKFAITYHVL